MGIIAGMITFCIGSAKQKREYFKKSDNIILDNTEVIFCASENGKNYFAIGDVPFANFTAENYLRYKRALCKDAPAFTLNDFGIQKTKKLKRLCNAQIRCIDFIYKYAEDKPVVVNLDGTKYSRKNARSLMLLLKQCKNAFVCVTDNRFIKRFKPQKILEFGKRSRNRPSFYRARALAVLVNAKKIAVM